MWRLILNSCPRKAVSTSVHRAYVADIIYVPEEREAFFYSLAMMKRNALAAPFELSFQAQKELEAAGSGQGDLMALHYRDEEVIYVQASSDRVTVIFSTMFREETDRVYGKVFLQVRPLLSFVLLLGDHGVPRMQEFVDARRLPTIQSAPQVLYTTREPPLEIRHLPGLNDTEDVGYVTFVLFPRHFANQATANSTITHIQLFRDYLHYHIKCSKAYMHSRMRHRVSEFQKVLNRAKTEQAVGDRKTAS